MFRNSYLVKEWFISPVLKLERTTFYLLTPNLRWLPALSFARDNAMTAAEINTVIGLINKIEMPAEIV